LESKVRIVFIGTVDFSLSALRKLVEMNCDVVGVCTKEKSKFNADYADLSFVCEENNIPFHYTSDINSVESYEWIHALKPDIVFCFGWSSLIGNALLSLPPLGVLGYHPAKLPKNRGRYPIIWALALGLAKSASTYFFMDDGADTGDILSQVEFEISVDDDASIVYEKIVKCALGQLEEFIPLLETNTFVKIKQNESVANSWRKRTKKDGVIDFRMNSMAIYNLIRALTKPYVGAHLVYKGKEVIIWKAEVILGEEKQNVEPGKIIEQSGDTVMVKTADGAIQLLEHEFYSLPVEGEYL